MQDLVKEFDDEKIKLFSEEGILRNIDKVRWKEGLRNSRWYGPFVWDDGNGKKIEFHSVSFKVFFDGVVMGIDLDSKRVYCLRFSGNGIEIGKGYFFS